MENFRNMVGWVPILIGLVFVQGLVALGGPCYQNTGGTVGCLSLGGPNCSSVGPFPGLDCNGGPWTLAQLAAMGRQALDPCLVPILDGTVPVPNSTAGNLATGELSQGNYPYPCTSTRTCTKTFGLNAGGNFIVGCPLAFVSTCSTFTIFTAGGGVCPVGSGGGGP